MSDKHLRNGHNIILQEDGEIIVDEVKVCNTFNNYFSTIASTIGFDDVITSTNDALRKHECHPSISKIKGKFVNLHNTFEFKPVSCDTIRKKLRDINIRKATGYDNIPGRLLRIAHSELSQPLCNVINDSLSQNCFPSNMKRAEVSPVFKKADNLNKGNYRPVSVLTAISKIYEGVIYEQMYDHFVSIFDDLLCAFRKKYSCQSLLVKFVDDIKRCLDNKLIVGVIFMDLSKAFDCLSHGLLISKLHAYGLTVSACELISSYLSNRMQRVKLAGNRSDWALLRKGVPQGSILGPLLFNVFINDMFLFIERCSLYNYADDNSLRTAHASIENVISSLKHDCEISVQWYKDNGMKANPSKFQFMVLGHDCETRYIHIDSDTVIQSEPYVKCLGITIDEKLNFTEHVSNCCKRAARQLNALARISSFLDFKSRKIIYNSFIMSNFSYSPLVWHFCGRRNNDKIEKIQERALRILYKDKTSSYEVLLRNADSTTVLTHRLRKVLLEVFKSIYGINIPVMNDIFEMRCTDYDMRRSVKLVQPKRRTTSYGLRSVSYLGPKLWNTLVDKYSHVEHMDYDTFKVFTQSLDELHLFSDNCV